LGLVPTKPTSGETPKALDVRRALNIRLHAEDEPRRELVIKASLAAADDAVEIGGQRPQCDCRVPRRQRY
jgi:hypothetical protein